MIFKIGTVPFHEIVRLEFAFWDQNRTLHKFARLKMIFPDFNRSCVRIRTVKTTDFKSKPHAHRYWPRYGKVCWCLEHRKHKKLKRSDNISLYFFRPCLQGNPRFLILILYHDKIPGSMLLCSFYLVHIHLSLTSREKLSPQCCLLSVQCSFHP